jgi:Leucine Rich repeats (2 copies)
MTPDEAYEEALRRIRVAEETGALELDLSGWDETKRDYSEIKRLTRLPPELKRLTSLQSLDLSQCILLSGDLSPLANLTLLRSLNLNGCKQIDGDISPLADLSLGLLYLEGIPINDLFPLTDLTALGWLYLDGCLSLRRFTPLESPAPYVETPQPVWV